MCISRLCYDVSVRLSLRLSVTEVHWRIIADLGFKFVVSPWRLRSKKIQASLPSGLN